MYKGTLRPRYSRVDEKRIKIEWVKDDGTIWKTETCVLENKSFVSQIECSGEFNIKPGYFWKEGKRHFVLKANPGKLGVPFNGDTS